MTNESDFLWILLSGRLKGQPFNGETFPTVRGELLFSLGLEGEKASCPKNISALNAAWEPGESCFPDALQGTAPQLS